MQDLHLGSAQPQSCLCRVKRKYRGKRWGCGRNTHNHVSVKGTGGKQVEIGVAPRCAGSTPGQCTPTIRPLSREEVVQVGVRVAPRCAGSTPVPCRPTTPSHASVEGRGGRSSGRGSTLK